MVRQRVRIRFRKQGDLRFLGHRDLLRTLERLFRRASLPLAMSQGFHPKVKMTFPSALAVGVAGNDEVMELELTEPYEPDQLHQLLSAQAPQGLVFASVEFLPNPKQKAKVERVVYQFPIPPERRDQVAGAVRELMSRDSHLIQRAGGRELDLIGLIEKLELTVDCLGMTHLVTPDGTVRPREVLAALGIEDLEHSGSVLTRTAVVLEPAS